MRQSNWVRTATRNAVLIFVLSKPKLVAATAEADSIAAQFSTTELAKIKLHLSAGESIFNTDGENHHHGHFQLAKENITTESTEVYSIVGQIQSKLKVAISLVFVA